jgi:hypothetical protein
MISEVFQAKPLFAVSPCAKARIPVSEKSVGDVGIQLHLLTLENIDRAVVIAVGRQDLALKTIIAMSEFS